MRLGQKLAGGWCLLFLGGYWVQSRLHAVVVTRYSALQMILGESWALDRKMGGWSQQVSERWCMGSCWVQSHLCIVVKMAPRV